MKPPAKSLCFSRWLVAFTCGFIAGVEFTTIISSQSTVGRNLGSKPTCDNESNRNSNNEDAASWGLVHVFKGEQKKLPPSDASQEIALQQKTYATRPGTDDWTAALFNTPNDGYYSQARQDFLVTSIFNFLPKGYFVDLAANHAYTISNTYALEQRLGWMGICVEANAIYWQDLSRMRSCHVVAAAVGSENGQEIPFRFPAGETYGGFGGLVGDNFDNKPGAKNVREAVLPTITLENVLKKFDAPKEIQYLSLDVEGAELFIMEKFPFDKYTFQLITVERPNPDLIKIFRNAGYRFVKKLVYFGDMMFAHESVLPLLNLTAVGINKRWDELDRGETQNQTDWSKMVIG